MWFHPQAKIILCPQEIRQQQQIPLYLTQILYSQVRFICTPGCYVHPCTHLDLTGEHIKSKEDIEATFHALNLCPQEDKEEKSNDRKETGGTSKSK